MIPYNEGPALTHIIIHYMIYIIEPFNEGRVLQHIMIPYNEGAHTDTYYYSFNLLHNYITI
jgi:hypothetical protein